MSKDNTEWRLKNPERWKELQKNYRDKNKVLHNAKARKLYHENKGKVMSHIEAGRIAWASKEKKMIETANKIFEKGLKPCTICGIEKKLDEYYPDPRNTHTMLQGACKQCQNSKNKKNNKVKRETTITNYGGFCELCQTEITDGIGYALHHISYKPERLVLLCRKCHNTLHALRIYKLDFVKKHGSDMAPYEWAKQVINLYETKKESENWNQN